MAKVIDAEKLKAKYPDRKSLNQVLDAAPVVPITKQIESVVDDMCQNYCKMPFKYSANEWEDIRFSADSPCKDCPLNRL